MERAKIKHQQVQLQGLFMNQPEGIIIYRYTDKTPVGDSDEERRRQEYAEDTMNDNFGLNIMLHNQAIFDITRINIDEGGILTDDSISDRRFRLLESEWLQTVSKMQGSQAMSKSASSEESTVKSMRQIMKLKPEANELVMKYYQMKVDDNSANDKYISVTVQSLIFN